jgi:hypothetical protein
MCIDGTIGYLVGKLQLLRIECPTCGRQGRYHVARLLDELGPDYRLTDWLPRSRRGLTLAAPSTNWRVIMIVVTAPAENIGHQVLSHLLVAGASARVIVRDASKLPEPIRNRVEVVEGSHGDAGIVERAFAGADTLFWLVPPNPKARTVDEAYVDFTRPAAAALQRHGVKRVVDITALGRGTPWADRAGLVTSSFRMDDLIASTLDNAEPRTPENTTPTSFRQWCEEMLKPAVLG